MNKKILLYPFLLLIILIPVLGDTEYNFLSTTQIYTTNTNDTYILQGNDNNTNIIIGHINGTNKEVRLNNVSNIYNLLNFNANCNNSAFFSNNNNGFIYKFFDNSSVCFNGLSGTAYYFNGNGISTGTPSLSTNQFIGYTLYNNQTYQYDNGGNPVLFNKKLFPALTSYPALNCYSQLSTVFQNNFGVNLSLNGGLNQTYSSGTLIQHNLSLFYFKVDNRWFYLEETGSNDCTAIANTLQEATLNFPTDISTTGNRYIIINDNLYVTSKNGGTSIYLLTSQEVDIYNGLVCNDDKTLCYNQSGVCLPNNEFYTGINSSNYLCTNVSLINDDVYCNSENLIYYAGGCLNTGKVNLYSVSYTSGTGYNSSSCDNDCIIEGLTYSDTATSYKQCGFYDSDTCLDWGNSIPCADGEYSLNGFCYSLNTSGNVYYNNRAFTSTPNLEISSSYDVNSLPKKVNYNFEGTFGVVGIDYNALPTSFYITKICDYTSTNLLNDLTQRFINDTYSYSLSGYTNGDTMIRFTLPYNGSVNFKGLDALDRQIYIYNVSIDETYGVCIYNNNSLVACESVDYLDIKNIELTIKTTRPQVQQLHSIKLIINKNNNAYQDIYTGVYTPNNNPVSSLIKLNVTSNNVSLSYVNVFNEQQLSEPWKNTTWTMIQNGNIIYQHNCVYSSVGCKTLRSYYQDSLTEGLWNYQDWNICINSLNGENYKPESEGNSLFKNFTKTHKIVFSFVLGILLLMFFTIYGVTLRGETEGKAFTWIGVFLFVSAEIFFAIIGWLPVWILIIAGIIASLGVGVFFISKSQGV